MTSQSRLALAFDKLCLYAGMKANPNIFGQVSCSQGAEGSGCFVICVQEEAYRPDPLASAIASLIKADPETYLDKFNFRSEICISCDWRRMELSPKVTIITFELELELEFDFDIHTQKIQKEIRAKSASLHQNFTSFISQ